MPPILRSVVAQCYRRGGGRSIGSRNFSSSPPGSSTNESNGERTTVALIVRRGVAVAVGYGLGALLLGNPAAKYEEKRQERMRKFNDLMEEREKIWSGLAGNRMKSRASLVSDRKF